MEGLAMSVFFLLLTVVSSNNELVSSLCNSQLYSYGDPFGKNLDLVLDDLVRSTPEHNGKDYTNISPRPFRFVYGHAQCSRGLTASKCEFCLRDAVAALSKQCGVAFGARVTLADCFMRYEAYPFGAESESVLLS